jgi:collagenase-like PrtC family protease
VRSPFFGTNEIESSFFVCFVVGAVLVACACFCLLKNYLEKKNRNLKGETKEAKKKAPPHPHP